MADKKPEDPTEGDSLKEADDNKDTSGGCMKCSCCPGCIRKALGCADEDDDDELKAELACRVSSTGRKCTDCYCCVVFVLTWLIWIGIAVVGARLGEPQKLVYPSDFMGIRCGSKTTVGDIEYDYTKKKKAYFPKIGDDLLKWFMNNGKDLTPEAIMTMPLSDIFSVNFTAICVTDCPAAETVVCTQQWYGAGNLKPDYADVAACGTSATASGLAGFSGDSLMPGSPFCQNCYAVGLKTKNFLYRCLDISSTMVNTNEVCFLPNETSTGEVMKATDPQCKMKTVTKDSTQQTTASKNPIERMLGEAASSLASSMADVEKSYQLIFFFGTFGALLFSLTWVIFLRFCAGCVIWTTIVLTVLLTLGGTIICWLKSGYIDTTAIISAAANAAPVNLTQSENMEDAMDFLSDGDSDKAMWKVGAIVTLVLFTIMVFLLLWLCKQIKEAVAIVKEASKVMAAVPSIIFYPVATAFQLLLMFAFFLYTFASIATSPGLTIGNLASSFDELTAAKGLSKGCNLNMSTYNASSSDSSRCAGSMISATVGQTNLQSGLLYYIIFMFLWTAAFTYALDCTVIAGVVSRWYWTRPSSELKGRKPMWEKWPLLISLKRALRFHLGSLALGSFLVAVVQSLRLVLAYVTEQMKKNGASENRIVKVALAALACCMWCFEKSIKFITKNSYILVAMRGFSFCKACVKSFMLVLNNMKRFMATGVVSSVFIFLGKLCVMLGVAIISYMTLDFNTTMYKDVKNKFVPCIFASFISYFVASSVLAVYELSIDTILLCFCEDYRIHEGNKQNVFMSKSLRKLGGITGEPLTWEKAANYDPDKPIPQGGCMQRTCCSKEVVVDEEGDSGAGISPSEVEMGDVAGSKKTEVEAEGK